MVGTRYDRICDPEIVEMCSIMRFTFFLVFSSFVHVFFFGVVLLFVY